MQFDETCAHTPSHAKRLAHQPAATPAKHPKSARQQRAAGSEDQQDRTVQAHERQSKSSTWSLLLPLYKVSRSQRTTPSFDDVRHNAHAASAAAYGHLTTLLADAGHCVGIRVGNAFDAASAAVLAQLRAIDPYRPMTVEPKVAKGPPIVASAPPAASPAGLVVRLLAWTSKRLKQTGTPLGVIAGVMGGSLVAVAHLAVLLQQDQAAASRTTIDAYSEGFRSFYLLGKAPMVLATLPLDCLVYDVSGAPAGANRQQPKALNDQASSFAEPQNRSPVLERLL